MDVKANSSALQNGLGIKVEGDLGALQIIEEANDSDEDRTCDKQKDSRTGNSLANIPGNLIQASTSPILGSAVVTNSENVQIGHNTYFNGPVTIKQIIHTKSGVENPSYTKTEDEHKHRSGAKYRQKPKCDDCSIKNFHIQTWHKLTFSAVCFIVIGGIICAIVFTVHSKNSQNENGLPNFSDTNVSSNHAMVVGLCYENYQIIIITILLVPLTLLLMLYSLLTKDISDGNKKSIQVIKKNNLIAKKNIDLNLNDSCMPYCAKADQLLIAPGHLRIVSRSDWLAQPETGALDEIIHPVPWVIITHTATESCSSQSICVLRVRLIQSFHVESRGWYDIGYNFLIGGDGSAYYGRGWDYIGAHTKGYNKYSIGIAFIGTFNNEPPPKQQIDACKKLIKQGVEQGKLAKNYKLFGHRQLMSTLSPGDKLYDIIKEWPNFVKNVDNLSELLPNY